jgi:hypothetical protein
MHRTRVTGQLPLGAQTSCLPAQALNLHLRLWLGELKQTACLRSRQEVDRSRFCTAGYSQTADIEDDLSSGCFLLTYLDHSILRGYYPRELFKSTKTEEVPHVF